MLRPFVDNIQKSLLRNIRISQNLVNEFAHAFATCTGPSRLGLEFEARDTVVVLYVCFLLVYSFCHRPQCLGSYLLGHRDRAKLNRFLD